MDNRDIVDALQDINRTLKQTNKFLEILTTPKSKGRPKKEKPPETFVYPSTLPQEIRFRELDD